MAHYIQYQKCDNSPDWIENFFIYTKKNLECYPGDTIWLIAAEKIYNKTHYYLVKRFLFTHKEYENNSIHYHGKDLIYKNKTIEITGKDWFINLFKELRNGQLGFSKLPVEFIEILEKEMNRNM